MKLLLDTHPLLWWLLGNDALSLNSRAAIGDAANTVWVSAASAMEITTKHRLGNFPV